MNKAVVLILIGFLSAQALWAGGPTPTVTVARDVGQERLEYSFLANADWLEKSRLERIQLQAKIRELQTKIANLRHRTGPNPNVIDEMRLKSDLNDLQDELKTDATLEKQQEEKQAILEKLGASLVTLYNDRIESLLATPYDPQAPASLDPRLQMLNFYVRKRERVQALLTRFHVPTASVNVQIFLSTVVPKGTDRESLQLTLDLFHDHKAALEEQLKKWSDEESELKNELKLQGKMREFMDDFQGMNDLPQSKLKDDELQGMVGKSQKSRLESRLSEVQAKIALGQKTLSQITQMMGRIQYQLDKKEGVMKP